MNKNNSGSVLIYVLGISATLATVLATFQMENILVTKRVGALLREAEAKYMAYSAQALTKIMLTQDLKTNAVDGVGDNWYRFQTAQTFPINNGSIKLTITDANSIHNINQLFTTTDRDKYFQSDFKRYIEDIGITAGFADVAKDWIDNNSTPTGSDGAEQFDYASKTPPYAPANKPITTIGDLRLLKGYNPKTWDKLTSYINVLPRPADINVNTASKELLISLFPNKIGGITQAIGARKNEPYTTEGDFLTEISAKKPKSVELTTQTTYFNLDAEITMYQTTKKLQALYERSNGKVILRRIQWQ